jgi:hypothetical protein
MASDIDALFKLPLGEFTAARNALVSRLKKAGHQAEAAAAKALPKPSVSAWVVNQLYWRHGYLFGRLLEAGERLRRAQTTRQASTQSRELAETRREVLAALAAAAAQMLREIEYSDTRAVMRRVTSTLEALSAYGSAPGAPSAGRLTGDLEPPGFDSLAGLQPLSARQPDAKRSTNVARSAKPPNAAAQRREEQRLVTAAKSAVRRAERELSVARQHAERAAAKHKAAVADAKKSEGRRAELERQLTVAAKRAEAAKLEEHAAEAEARDALQVVESAEQALQHARSGLNELAPKQNVEVPTTKRG